MVRTSLDSVGSLSIRQPREGYRFSMDPVLLSAFVDLNKNTPKHIADLGSGTGIAGLLLARRLPKARITLVELQSELHKLALENIEANGLSSRVNALNLDIRQMRGELAGLDAVVANPPFRRPGTGRISARGDGQSGLARHETELPLDELCFAAARALKGRGRFYIVYLPERLLRLTDALREARLEPKRLRFVHGRQGLEARILMMEAVRDGKPGLKVEPPLYIYADESDEYTEEVASIYES